MNDKTLSNDNELTYEELKAMCRELCRITSTIFGMTYVHSKENMHAKLDKIHDLAGEGYNMAGKAAKKGLWS